MAIAEALPQPFQGYRSRGNEHSQAIKKALQAKRIALRHTPEMLRGLVDLARTAESEAVRKDCMIYVIDRGLGRTQSSPEDIEAAAGLVIQVLSGIARNPSDPIDVTPVCPQLPETGSQSSGNADVPSITDVQDR